MSKLFTGSICLTDLLDKASIQHSAFSKSQKNGKVYANILIWENDKLDNFGNTHSLQLNSTKEKKIVEGSVYIGNAKPVESKSPQLISNDDAKSFTQVKDELPF
jgi:hypothetical protein